ncbi:malonic semialdehyde reductase [Phenylobacterium sp.]|uniref:malonic semialdehyde reductase n=1 Tax=Phenylobacterium sp. TaxID=1871053 RepID=UPI00289FD4E1|nr:malonic semialdehyde reductase [Phenylobacterium sp.]
MNHHSLASEPLTALALDRLFRTARSANAWADRETPERLLREIYDLAKLGPTSANVSPARFLFLTTPEAKARLAPHLSSANRAKTIAAPVTAIIGYDLDFAERIPELFPHNPGAKAWFADPGVAAVTALRNGTLQGAYLMLAARAVGLDCGPLSGFDHAGVDAEFFAGTRIVSNFICNLGYADRTQEFERLPRLSFEQACEVI